MKRFISERGQSLVELGVSLLILLYLLSGAAEFGDQRTILVLDIGGIINDTMNSGC